MQGLAVALADDLARKVAAVQGLGLALSLYLIGLGQGLPGQVG